jgi:endonuclease YncB( thermonuclease family)
MLLTGFQPFQYRAIVVKVDWKTMALVAAGAVYDGDTAYFFYDRGERQYDNPSNRFYGMDCPEVAGVQKDIWASDPQAKEKAIQARDRVRALIQGKEVLCVSMGLDKYGRRMPLIWLSEADYPETDKTLNQLLINEGLAKRYMDEKNVLKDKPV